MRPEVVSNRQNQTVAAALSGYWRDRVEDPRGATDLAIASAYFNIGGFELLADQLERAGSVRLLLGAEPDVAANLTRPRQLRSDTLPDEDRARRLEVALAEHAAAMAVERDLVPLAPESDALIQRLLAWLDSGRVEVRRLERTFLHGKAYIVETGHDGVLVGSSNLTRAGLTTNVELNLGQYQPGIVGQVVDWFDAVWQDAVPYDLAGLYRRDQEWSPYLIYLRMLFEFLRSELDLPEPRLGLPLTEFQADGLVRALDLLERRHGVLIADGVGLGKTFLAGELLHRAVRVERRRALLIAPAALRDGTWDSFLRWSGLKGAVQVVSFEQLAQDARLGGPGGLVLDADPTEYSLVVIDEAHAYRNRATDRVRVLRRLLAGSPQKDLVLLTATPVNNSLMDLYNLLSLFIRNDAAFRDLGIPSLRGHFAAAQAEDPDDLTPDRLFDVLNEVAVRRTRSFIKKFYPDATFTRGEEQVPIRFPQPVVLRVEYDLERTMPGLVEQLAYALGVDPSDPTSPIPSDPKAFVYGDQLTLARYEPWAYRVSDPNEGEGGRVAQARASGLLRSGLLKRFESSVAAFARTCRTMAESHGEFLKGLDEGYVLTGRAVSEWRMSDSDDLDDLMVATGPRGGRPPVESAEGYDVVALRAAVEADRRLLEQFAERAEAVPNASDPKLDALVEELAAIAAEAEAEASDLHVIRDRRKVLIFSYFEDTVRWIGERLDIAVRTDPRLAPYAGRLERVSGNEGSKQGAMLRFAPRSMEAPEDAEDLVDCLIATDVLSEGVNLQQARHIINFDLPWNPMRLVQRHGRIDRIGSDHDRVFLRCFFPSRTLDLLLRLEEALQRKISQAAASIGVEDEIIPGSRRGDVVLTHTREQIEAIRDGDAGILEAGSTSGVPSHEEFRREFALRMEDPSLRAEVESLPWVAGSGRLVTRDPGFVFCARVGDYPRPEFRFVPLDCGGSIDHGGIADNRGNLLGRAQCEEETPRVMPGWVREQAYGAWASARHHIADAWHGRGDAAGSGHQRISPTMREAARLVRENPPAGLSNAELHFLLDSIEVPYAGDVVVRMKSALRSSGDPAEQVEAIRQVVVEEALAPPPPGSSEPLPEIALEDVHLVCWLALVTPSEDGPIDE